jgi:hypothetical protein
MLYVLFVQPVLVASQNALGDSSTPLTPPAAPSAEDKLKGESNQDSQRSELAIVGKGTGEKPDDFRFKMGESVQIQVTGQNAAKIRTELNKAAGLRALKLYLNYVRIDNLTISAVDAGNKLLLSAHLVRNANDDDNRKAWDTLLKKQEGMGYLMTLPVALAVGNELPLAVQSALPFQFYVVSATAKLWTLGIELVIFLVAYYLVVTQSNMLCDAPGSSYSLGKSQMAFWGLLVALTFVGIWIVTGTMERIPPQVLILLGISGATGLSAIVIGESKKAGIQDKITKLEEEKTKLENEERMAPAAFPPASKARLQAIEPEKQALSQQLKASKSEGFWSDICNDGNGLSFHRLQVVIWTVILGMVFVRSVAQVLSMPEFPETLLVLLGISAGTYLGFKIPEKS